MAWKDGMGLPYDGWFNGDPNIMILKGTYADYRPRLLQSVENGFYGNFSDPQEERIKQGQVKLQAWDAQWNAISVEQRNKKRNQVKEDSTPKPVIEQTVKGPIMQMKSKPSEGIVQERRQEKKKSKRPKLPSGSLAEIDEFISPAEIIIGGLPSLSEI